MRKGQGGMTQGRIGNASVQIPRRQFRCKVLQYLRKWIGVTYVDSDVKAWLARIAKNRQKETELIIRIELGQQSNQYLP